MIDLVDAQAADHAVGFEHQRAVALPRRVASRLIEQSSYVENWQNCSVQVAHAAECRRCGWNRRHEAERDDFSHPTQLDRVTGSTDREHDDVAQFGHGSSIP